MDKHSRLSALSKLGVVPNFMDIQKKTVIIVGIGGVGSVAAEMLVRCAIGKLVLFDYDKVENANMNRMFFTPDQVGLSKVDAAISTLIRLSEGDVDLVGHNGNITSIENYVQLKAEILRAQKNFGAENTLVLCCVDNYAARTSVNQACLETDQVWLESGVSETAMSGHIQVLRPGSSACFECAPPTVVAEGGDERNILRNGVCAASLPTTMGVISGLLVQTSLKILLRFGEVHGCVAYNAMTDFFPILTLKPNPDCDSDLCKSLQKRIETSVAEVEPKPEDEPFYVKHLENDWDIQLVQGPSKLEGGATTSDKNKSASISDLVQRLKRD